MGTGVPSTRPIRRGSPLTAVMVVCFLSISARTSDGIGTFNCWCCWRIGLCFDVEKRLGPGVATTHATPASLGWPRRRIDTASRVSKSTPCVRCVQPCARRFITEPGARRRLPILLGVTTLALAMRIAQELLGGCPPSSLVAARRRRECPNRCRPFGVPRALSCARRSCTLVLPARFARERPAPLQAALPMRPESKVRHDTPPRQPVRRGGAPRGAVAVGP